MENNWYDIFATNKHATYGNDKKSVVLVISNNPSKDEIKVEEMKKNPTKNVDKIDWKFAEYDVDVKEKYSQQIEDVIKKTSNIRYIHFFISTIQKSCLFFTNMFCLLGLLM